MLDERKRFLRNLVGNIVVLMHMVRKSSLQYWGSWLVRFVDDFHLVSPDFQLSTFVSLYAQRQGDRRGRVGCAPDLSSGTYQRIP